MSNNQLFYGLLLSLTCIILFANCQQNDAKSSQNSQQTVNDKSEASENAPRQLPFRGPKATLYYSKECQQEIAQHCPSGRKGEISDLTVLSCIHNDVPDLSVINKECQNLLYTVKKNLTISLKLDDSAINICREDIPKLVECQNIDKENNGHLISCLLDNKENITGVSCRIFLKNVAALVFSDYRLVYKFVEDCQNDITRFTCGRIDKDEESVHQQGQTIECLSKKFQELDNKCKKQILRINELQSEDFHLDRPLYFACKDDREKFCERITSGEGRVYQCLMKNKFNPLMSKQCQEQLTRRQKIIAEDVKADKSLVKACQQDILKHQCRQELRLHADQTIQLAGLILCLENAIQHDREVDPDCKSELVEHRKMIMSDYQLSPDVVRFCSNEIRQLCSDGVERNGKTLHCLLNQAKQNRLGKNQNNFSGKCYRTLQEFLKVVNAGEDVRIDPHLQAACQNLLNTYCKDVQPGKGRVVECLLKYIDSTSITDECEERLLEIQFFVARDWTLNTRLFDSCRQDAVDHCKAQGSWKDFGDNAESIVPCLYHYIDEMSDDDDNENTEDSNPNEQQGEKQKVVISPKCIEEIRKMMRTRANRIELIPEVQENCARDLAKYCSDKESYAKGEEMRCLQANYKNLEDDCQKAVKSYSIAESKDLSLDQILMNACMPIINEFCSNKREDKEELLDCMIAQKNNPKINEKCRAGIEHHQLINLEDIKFNTKFVRKCKKEIREHCYEKTTKPDIISCLSEIVLNDALLDKKHRIEESCRDQLRYELLQMNELIKLDPDLSKACQSDMARLCQDVQPGKGRMLECLRTNREKLSADCSAKLRKRDQINLIDQNVDYTLQTNCKNAIKEHCKVNSEDTIACLRKHLLKPTLEFQCRVVVINRIMIQNKDFRLNPTLWKACLSDVQKQCVQEVANINDFENNLNGEVLKCLKKSFVNNKLTKQCEVEVDQVIREAANIDYRLDPLVAENCMSELENFCSEKLPHEKESCLRLAFHKQKIKEKSKCFDEVRRLIIEGAADIFVDEELSNVCSVDLVKYCNDVPPGASQQLKCLLNIKSQKRKLSETCLETLNSRQELWKLAKISDSLTGINDLAQLINNSEHRSYLVLVLFAFTLIVFTFGCLCRRAVLGERRLYKNK